MSLLDHFQSVRPTGEECCRSSSNGALETQTSQIERKSGQIPCCIRQNETQQPSQATSRIFVTSSVWVHHPQHVIGARCCTEQQQQPCALRIPDVWNPVQKHLVFGGDGSQLCFHELFVSQRSPQHNHTLFFCSQGRMDESVTSHFSTSLNEREHVSPSQLRNSRAEPSVSVVPVHLM